MKLVFPAPKYLMFHADTCSVSVSDKEDETATIALELKTNEWMGGFIRHHVYHKIHMEVFYHGFRLYMKRTGEIGSACLASPQPWLFMQGMVMWEGLGRGYLWNAIRPLVRNALDTMAAANLGPAGRDGKKHEEPYFCTMYAGGAGQYHMFANLRRVWRHEQKHGASYDDGLGELDSVS